MRKRLISLLTTTAIVLGILPFTPITYAEEVAIRDSFEVNFDGWIADSDATELTAHEGEGVDGSRGMKLSNRQSPNDGAHSQKGFYLDGGVKYNYSIFVKADTAETFTLSLEWLFYDDDIYESAILAAKTVKAGQWTEITANFAAPAGTEGLTVSLTTDSAADFWFDEFSATHKIKQSPYAASANVPANPGLKDYYANHFRVGNILNGTTVRNNTITALILREYNSITAENEHKPDATMTRTNSTNTNIRATFNTGAAAINDFCARNNIPMRGHVLFWHGQTPDWFFLQNVQDTANYRQALTANVPWATPTVMNQRMESYVQNLFALFQSQYPALNLYAYDVVNEFVRVSGSAGPRLPGFDAEGAGGQAGSNPGNSPWQAVYGANDTSWVRRAFEIARRHAPANTKLFYNDYNEFDPTKRDYIINTFLRPYFRDGILDGMGMQGHINSNPSTTHWSNWGRFRDAMTAYANVGTGFEVQITELDITTNANDGNNSDYLSNQPTVYRNIFEHAISINANANTGSFTAICIWGPDDANSWITRRNDRTNVAPLLHDRSGAAKPAYTAVRNVVPESQWGNGSAPEFRNNPILRDADGPVVPPIQPDSRGYFFHDTFENNTFGWEPRGGTTVETSGRTAAAGAESLAIRGRTLTWHGAQKILNSAFVAGTAYSFSVCAVYLDGGAAQEELSLTLEHTINGETQWTNIARATVARGQWVQLANRNFTIPAGATNLRLVFESPTNAEITLYIDEAIGAVAGTVINAPNFPTVTTTATTTGGTPTSPTATTTPVTTTGTNPGTNFDELFRGITPTSPLIAGNFNNPLMTQRFSADPNALVYNGRIYVYSTNDVIERDAQGNITNNTYGRITTINMKSSADMVNWTDHGAIPAAGPQGAATFASQSWAPTVAWKTVNGVDRFFLYFCNNASGIVVLTADSPTGPWTSPRNSMLISRSTPGTDGVPWVFDPSVFIDDDGQAYMYFGGGIPGGDNPTAAQQANPQTARVIRLGDDMISTVGSAQMIDAPFMFEAAEMFKRNGTYYFSYSANFAPALPATVNGNRIEAASIQYMTATNPMGPFTHRGTVLPRLGNILGNWGNSHQKIIEFKGQHYILYHSLDLAYAIYGTRDMGYRSTHADVLNFNADGTIIPVTATRTGVAQLEPFNPYQNVRASTIHRQGGIAVRGVGNTVVTDISRGNWISVKGVNFASGATSVTVRASAQTGGVIKVATGSPTGAAVGYINIPAGNAMGNHTATITGLTGTQDLYFIFSAAGMEFETWQFTPAGATTTTTATTGGSPTTPTATTTPPTTTTGGSPTTPTATTTTGGSPTTPTATTTTGGSPTTPTATTTTGGSPTTPTATTTGTTTSVSPTTVTTTTTGGSPTTPTATTTVTTTAATTTTRVTTTVTTTAATTTAVTAEPLLLGDVDDNGVVTILDALEILKFLAGLPSLVDEGGRNLDNALITEGSQETRKPTIHDALEILKFLASLPSEANKRLL